MTPFHRHIILRWWILLLVLATVGCAPSNPQQLRVTAQDGTSLARWRSQAAARFSGVDWREFDDGLQEIRLAVMFAGDATGREPIEAALCLRVHGLTVREVLVLGHEAALQRLERQKVELQSFAAANDGLVTKPGDTSSASYLDAYRERQHRRVRETESAIEQARKRLVALGGANPAVTRPAAHLRNEPLPRLEALAEIDRMIRKLRGVALLRFGEWPIELDPDGRRLPVVMRDEFAARRTAAQGRGRALIAVRVRDRWLIYEGPRELPRFPSVVSENLTRADLVSVEARWLNLQAELWAREVAGGIIDDDVQPPVAGEEADVPASAAQVVKESTAPALNELGDRQRILAETSKLIESAGAGGK